MGNEVESEVGCEVKSETRSEAVERFEARLIKSDATC